MWGHSTRPRTPATMQPRRFHLLVYLNALTLSTVLLVLAAQLIVIVPRAATPVSATPPVINATATTKQAEPQPTVPAANQFGVTATVAPHGITTCDSAPYVLPSRIDGSSMASGVYVTRDTPMSYAVHGSDENGAGQYIQRCSPIIANDGRFAATTGYSLATYYAYVQVGDSCRLTSLVITQHINQLLPAWTEGSTNAVWSTFLSDLHTHEQGHVDRDTAAAYDLYANLQNLQASTCSELNILISTTTSAKLRALNVANDNYDYTTKHGATQGAVL